VGREYDEGYDKGPIWASRVDIIDESFTGFFTALPEESNLQGALDYIDDYALSEVLSDALYLRLDGTNVPTADYSWTTNFTTTGTGTFGSTYIAILGDDSHTRAGYFTNSSDYVQLINGTTIAQLYNSSDGTTITMNDSYGWRVVKGSSQAYLMGSSEAVYGNFSGGTNYGKLGNTSYGVEGYSTYGSAVYGLQSSGNYGELGTSSYGVHGYASSGSGGYFTNSSGKYADLAGSYGGLFYDGSNYLYVCDGSYAVNTSNNVAFTGTIATGLSSNQGVYTDGSSILTNTPPTSGTLGYWYRSGTTIRPDTTNWNISTTGNIISPLIESSSTTTTLDIQPDYETSLGTGITFFKNFNSFGDAGPKIRLYGAGSSGKYFDIYLDQSGLTHFGGTASSFSWDINSKLMDNKVSCYGTSGDLSISYNTIISKLLFNPGFGSLRTSAITTLDPTTGDWDFISGNLTTTGILEVGHIKMLERSSDPTEPSEGECIIWMSDGTGKGDDGDVMIASKAGGTTKYGTLFDHSAGSAW